MHTSTIVKAYLDLPLKPWTGIVADTRRFPLTRRGRHQKNYTLVAHGCDRMDALQRSPYYLRLVRVATRRVALDRM